MKSFLAVRGMLGAEILQLVERARGMSDSTVLSGRTVGLLFFEPSTRTRLSFDMAVRRMGGWPLVFDPEWSSMGKGETIRDTVSTVGAIGADILVIRSSEEGLPESAHAWSGLPVINAGDGVNEHPTQALADAMTLHDRLGTVSGLSVAIVGDVAHSRVAGSLMHALPALGANLTLVGPSDLLPADTPWKSSDDLDTVIGEVDVVYMLRVQRERGAETEDDYVAKYQLGTMRARRMRPGAVVMHPGPVNRGVELTNDVADGPRSLILDQVKNGVPARMAVLAAIAEEMS